MTARRKCAGCDRDIRVLADGELAHHYRFSAGLGLECDGQPPPPKVKVRYDRG